MKHYVIYNAQGEILQTGTCPDDMLAIQGWDGVSVVEGQADLSLDYVFDGEVAPRIASPATLTDMTLASLPVPCVISINGTDYPCDDATAELSFPNPGKYAIKVIKWPYLDKEFEVTK